jgi:hypothetical protein
MNVRMYTLRTTKYTCAIAQPGAQVPQITVRRAALCGLCVFLEGETEEAVTIHF